MSTTTSDRPGGGTATDPASEARPPARDRTVLPPLPEVAPAAPVLTACLLAAGSLALLCVLAVLVPAPAVSVGPVRLPGGEHDLRVLLLLVLVTLAGSALGIGLVRGALPRAEATGSGASVDRSALVLRPAWRSVLVVARAWAVLLLAVVVPAWLGLLPLPVVGLVLPLAVGLCAPSFVVRRLAVAAARRRDLPVLAVGAPAALSGALTVAGPEREAPRRVVLTGELLAPAPRRGPRPAATGGAPPGTARRPGAGEWGFQPGPESEPGG
jgi:hypothetical protein